MTYEEAIAFIHSVEWRGSRPGLSRITALLEKLNNPQNDLRFVHIAGTNGKGSVSAMTESVLRAAGFRTGLFVSPYIKHFCERIQCGGKMISQEAFARLVARIKPLAETMDDAPTEFELITAVGFCYFAEQKCDVVVLETGMGGRLDSTNVIQNPLLTVITGISLDHTAFLGDTIEKIAAEKAGIAKSGVPMLWGGNDDVARGVIAQKCAALGVPFFCAGDTPPINAISDLSGTTLSYGTHRDIHVPLLGLYQRQNLCTVLAAIDLLRARGLDIPEEAVKKGLADVRWSGRFEKISDNPLIITDGAHNPEGVAAAAASIRAYFPEQKVLLLTGVLADKNHADMARTLASVAAEVFTITPPNPRALNASALAAEFRELGVPASAFASVEDAVKTALARARETDLPLIALGSLYLYADVSEAVDKWK